ncbi:chloroplast sensor kinase isoform X2 [Wolffia australiana]
MTYYGIIVYVRPAGSYVMDQLELHRVSSYSLVGNADIADYVVLIGNFVVPAGLRAAEAHLSNQQVSFIPECGAIVLPMVKHPFVVGFIVTEFPFLKSKPVQRPEDNEPYSVFEPFPGNGYELQQSERNKWEVQGFRTKIKNYYRHFMADHSAKAVIISRSLATAYVMDQKAMLLQQSSWQNSIRMSHLVEQIRSPLSNMRTLAKMLSVQLKRSAVPRDIVEDILVQGDYIRETFQQLQDAVYLTKANIVRYNEEMIKKVHNSAYESTELAGPLLPDFSLRELEEVTQRMDPNFALSSIPKDLEVPMPPHALAPGLENIRPCNVSNVLADLVRAAVPLAHNQKRFLKLGGDSNLLKVAVEESVLRQALSNLIEGALLRTNIGGEVDIVATWAPAGGVLIIIDDNGPDMHYMTQMHSLTPFGADLFEDDMIEDNMTWNFIAGLAISREILESYGCVVRVISPRLPNAALGTGGTRIELWLPTLESSKTLDSSQEQLQA